MLNYPELYKLFGQEDGTLHEPKTFIGLVSLLWYSLRTHIYHELVLFALAIASLCIAPYRKRHAIAAGMTMIYFVVLYLFFHIEPRYIYFTLPLLAILGGVTLDEIMRRIPRQSIRVALLIFIFAWPVAVVTRYHYLLFVPDTRTLAQQWIAKNITNEEFMLSSDSLRLPRTADSLALADAFGRLNASERYYASNHERLSVDSARCTFQNIHFWDTDTSIDVLDNYLQDKNPRYLIIEQWKFEPLSSLEQYAQSQGRLVTEFSQSSHPVDYDINNNFFAFNHVLFSIDRLGPTMRVYELR